MSCAVAQKNSRVCEPGHSEKPQFNHSFTPRRPQPPNARAARRRLSEYMRGKVPGFGTLFIHAGRGAWDWLDDPRAAVLSPDDIDPASRDWSVCQLATPPVLIINREASEQHLEATAMACLRGGARKVLFVGVDALPIWEARS